MMVRYERVKRGDAGFLAVCGQMLVVLSFLSACSSVPDAVNPVEWYKGARDLVTGSDEPEIAKPVDPKAAKTMDTADTRKGVPQGLIADRGNAEYAEPVRRAPAPSKPLVRRTPAPNAEQTAVAQAPAAAAPAVQTAQLPAPAQNADQGPDAPPASMNMTPPPPADIPEMVQTPGRPKRLQAQYEKRLAESAQTVLRPGMVDMGGAYQASAEDAPIHLIPPSSRRMTAQAKSGGRYAAALPVYDAAASFQVAALDFTGASAKLTKADRAAIAEVARLYKETGGMIRVVGFASGPTFAQFNASGFDADASQQRAEAVARELNRRGVPASKILVAADPALSTQGHSGAQVYLDVI